MNYKYKRNDSFQLQEIAGDYLLVARGAVALDFSSVVVFNETGVFLWKNMELWHSPEELATMLISEFAAPEETALQDVHRFLEKMQAENMVDRQEA